MNMKRIPGQFDEQADGIDEAKERERIAVALAQCQRDYAKLAADSRALLAALVAAEDALNLALTTGDSEWPGTLAAVRAAIAAAKVQS